MKRNTASLFSIAQDITAMEPAHGIPSERATVRVMITPDLARAWLVRNTKNRPIRKANVKQIAMDISQGRWHADNGETIKFCKDGTLQDGQTRLLAVIEANKAIVSSVCFGLDENAVESVDMGVPRSSGDILSTFYGVPSAPRVAGVAQFVLAHYTLGFGALNNYNRPTRLACVEFARDHQKEIIDAMQMATGQISHFKICATCAYIFSHQHPKKARQFFDGLRTGANLSPESPILRLREKLILNDQSKIRMKYKDVLAIFFISWNAFCAGEVLKQLKWRKNQPFPELSGEQKGIESVA